MKTLIAITYSLLSLLLIGCNENSSNKVSLKTALIKKMINSDKIKVHTKNGKINILKSGYCKLHDCEAYFQGYEDHIQIYEHEEMFMRGLANYLEIENIDQEEGIITTIGRNGKYDSIKIEL